MTIKETKTVILKWINSCDTSGQLDLIGKIVEKFINDVQCPEEEELTILLVKIDLKDEIFLKRLTLKEPEAPILFLNKNINR